QVIRKVIPGSGPAPKKPVPAVAPRVEVTGSSLSQKVPAGVKTPVTERESLPAVKKIIKAGPEPVPPSTRREDDAVPVPSFGTYCSRCGNRVPEGSGFCNRCGSQIVIPGGMAATTPVPVSVRQPADSETVAGSIKPVSKEIQAIPAPEQSSVMVPQNPPHDIHVQPVNEAGAPPEEEIPTPPGDTVRYQPDVNLPGPVIIPGPAVTESITSQNSGSLPPAGNPPAPPKPSGVFPFKFTKKTGMVLIIAIIILVVVLGAFFLYPKISGSGSTVTVTSSVSPTRSVPATVSTTIKNSETVVIPRETTMAIVPADGVYVHINYLGGWKGTFGIPSALRNVTNSGDRVYPVENATGVVQATFEKLDGSTRHDLLVEIFKNGNRLASGNTSAGFGKVTVSADT
ncbi:MAG: hypothetical protein LUQ54_02865, partial [Methanoregula sp.]|nr:hypothetical protein [Methanoregula sp.]